MSIDSKHWCDEEITSRRELICTQCLCYILLFFCVLFHGLFFVIPCFDSSYGVRRWRQQTSNRLGFYVNHFSIHIRLLAIILFTNINRNDRNVLPTVNYTVRSIWCYYPRFVLLIMAVGVHFIVGFVCKLDPTSN